MARLITITLSEAEAEIILEALDTHHDIYLQSARDAVADGSHDLAVTFGSARRANLRVSRAPEPRAGGYPGSANRRSPKRAA